MRAGQADLFALLAPPPPAAPAAPPAGDLLALIEALAPLAEIPGGGTATDRVVIDAAAWDAARAAYAPLLRRWMEQPIAGRPLPGADGVFLAAMHRMDVFVCGSLPLRVAGQDRRGIVIAAREHHAARAEALAWRAAQADALAARIARMVTAG